MKRLILTIVFVLLIGGFATNVQPAHAIFGGVGGTFLNCTSSNFTGTSDGTAVAISLSVGGSGIGSAIGPVVGGSFNITVSYPAQPSGTLITAKFVDDNGGATTLFGTVPFNCAS